MAASDTAPAVEARGLGKRYDKLVALRGVDVVIPRGAIYGVLGPGGAGKTTLVKCIGLITAASGGSLQLFGEPATGRPAQLRARIGYMPQTHALYEELSARFNIEFFARGAPRARIDQLLEMVQLARRADDPVLTFSGGMKQRVSLACALARDPELLLLDEPTAGIDPLLRITMWEEFGRLRDAGKTIVVSTHQIDEAAHCDRLLIIREGAVLVEGPPDEILGRGGATVRARTRDGRALSTRLEDPAHQLAAWLAAQPLAELVELRVDYDSLDTVLVNLIRAREAARA